MTTERAPAAAEWLALREEADAAARAAELVRLLRADLPTAGRLVVHDLGCGTGSMARWLAPQLDGPQHWVMHDQDAALLALAEARPPVRAADGGMVTTETRLDDVTRLEAAELNGASLVTASALLDVLTIDELRRFLASCASARCPVLLTLSVTGHVELSPEDPLDQSVAEAFNAHQRRSTGAGRLLGPDAVEAAVEGLIRLGLDVQAGPSPWRLGPEQAVLAAEWFAGWWSAAGEHLPELRRATGSYGRRRLAEAAAGRLSVTVHHTDLLARPG